MPILQVIEMIKGQQAKIYFYLVELLFLGVAKLTMEAKYIKNHAVEFFSVLYTSDMEEFSTLSTQGLIPSSGKGNAS